VVKVAHTVTGGLNLTYGTSGTYGGVDQFGRVIDQKWNNDSSTDKDRYKYGYDRNSSRTYRENALTHGSTPKLDDWYSYGGSHRLQNMDRGTLTGTPYTGITGTPEAEQDFTLDAVGNWAGFVVKATGSTTLSQSREHNKVNEIADTSGDSDAIGQSTGSAWIDPAYDAAGNMTLAPKPGAEHTAAAGLLCVHDAGFAQPLRGQPRRAALPTAAGPGESDPRGIPPICNLTTGAGGVTILWFRAVIIPRQRPGRP